jgi:hypothetical protein
MRKTLNMSFLISILVLVGNCPCYSFWNVGVGFAGGPAWPSYSPMLPPYYGPVWGGDANVIVTRPIPRYYGRECETVQFCNQYDECWLERECE